MATDDNTLMSLVNEKGPRQLNIHWDNTPDTIESITDTFTGIPIGQATIGNFYILFTNDITDANVPDRIYKFWFEGDVFIGRELFGGKLNFSSEHPIETLVYYENESIQKSILG